MREMDDDSFDVILADPPYGTTSLDWDRVDNDWLIEVFRLAPQLWCFGPMRFWLSHGHRFREAGWKYAQELIWEKHNGSSFHADRFRRVHEIVTHWYRGRWSDLHTTTQFTMDARPKVVRRKERPAHMGVIENSTYVSHDGGPRMMRSVLQIRSEHGRAVHPTQKPIDLLRPLLRYSCPDGGRILDPFAGSGSTGVAAQMDGYEFVGIEKNHEYAVAARERLREPVECA